ncbi:HTH-type transcriptional regulator CdhR [Thalassocella blandensis]|nr:HTH-type transcriptional regulator CdhR [Thalassocella blandensis]
MISVGVLAMHGFVPFDLSIPCEAFKYVRLAEGKQAYQVHICGEQKEVSSSAFKLVAPYGLRKLSSCNTVIIPGIEDIHQSISPAVIASIQRAWKNGARIVSICSGAFVLAQTGLLAGRRATTHWLASESLAQRFPDIQVDPDVLYVDDKRIMTSAGATAGIDMCLHIIRKDYGASVAADAAKLSVTALERSGGQKQFIQHELPHSSANLAPLIEWMHQNLHQTLSVELLANKANMSMRTFARKFSHQTGTTPSVWLSELRIRKAQMLLEQGDTSVERIAELVGFKNATTFRRNFLAHAGVSPSQYRHNFRSDMRE